MDIQHDLDYYYLQNGQTHGPVNGAQLIDLAKSGQLKADDPVSTNAGMESAVAASTVNQLAPIFSPASLPVVEELPSAPGSASTGGGGASPYFKEQATPAAPATREPKKDLSKIALFSFLLGVVSIIATCLFQYASVLVIVMAVVAMVLIKKSEGKKSGMGFAITGLVLGFLGIGFGVWITNTRAEYQRKVESGEIVPAKPAPPDPIDKAESLIRIANTDQIGFGNTKQAVVLATSFAKKMKEVRKSMFTGDPDAFSLSDGEFLTYCRINEDSCALIFHAPSLRKYDGEAKDALSDIAWTVASSLLVENDVKVDKLGVGMKGMVLYHRIDIGKVTEGETLLDAKKGIEKSSTEVESLRPFFPIPKV